VCRTSCLLTYQGFPDRPQSAKLNPLPADKMLSWAVGAGTALEEGEGPGWSMIVSDEEREEQRIGEVGCVFDTHTHARARATLSSCWYLAQCIAVKMAAKDCQLQQLSD
jgi:hypothetical protein